MKLNAKKMLGSTLVLLLALPVLAQMPSQKAQREIQEIWKARDAAQAFYNDVKWHESHGISYDEAAEIDYKILGDSTDNPYSRTSFYKPFSDCSQCLAKKITKVVINHWDLNKVTCKHNDEDFFKKYQQKNYYDLFTMDNFEENFSAKDYVADVVYGFHDAPSYAWGTFVTKDIPEDLLKAMQANVARYFSVVCATETEYIDDKYPDLFHIDGTNAYEECQKFIKNAKEYGLWTDEAQRIYDNLLGKENVEEQVSKQKDRFTKRFWRSLKRTLHSIQNADVDLTI